MSLKCVVASKTSSKNIFSLFYYLQNYIEAFHLVSHDLRVALTFDCLLESPGDNNNNNNVGNNNNHNK